MKESNAATQAGAVDIDNGLILLVQLVFFVISLHSSGH